MEWISVKTKLPEENVSVLVYNGAKILVHTARYTPLGVFASCDAGGYFCGVTHWMPLPEPPKEV